MGRRLEVIPRKLLPLLKQQPTMGSDEWRCRTGRLVDWVRVRIRSGAGGSGASAFDRSKMNPRGRPSGGDGGNGGSVWMRTDPGVSSLGHLGNLLMASDGQPGGSNNRGGANGRDLWVTVPPGTRVTRIEEPEPEYEEEIDGEWVSVNASDSPNKLQTLGVLPASSPTSLPASSPASLPASSPASLPASFVAKEGKDVLLLKGGTGGRGNLRFGHNNHECERGQAGAEAIFELDMARMADIGLIGFPNAGKSSLLRAISNARPAVAPYPFTTLTPQIGVVVTAQVDDGRSKPPSSSSISVADIPGLIQGAHLNLGLGHRFLKHVAKSRALVCVLDLSRADPVKDLAILEDELFRYDHGLCSKIKLVVGNKMDLLSPQQLATKMAQLRDEVGPRQAIVAVSAREHACIDELVNQLLLIDA